MADSTTTTGPIPTVSYEGSDGTLAELLYDADARTTALAIARPSEVPTVEKLLVLPGGERLAPYSPDNNLIRSGCVLLPSGIGLMGSKADLVCDLVAFLDRYVALSDPFAEIAAHYVLLSWVYDAFNELPYLRFRGDFGTGKTRALLAVGSLCYKPFFASGASTVSPIFHVLDAFGGTLVLDEADFRFSDATADLTKILNNGNMRGLPVLRTMTNRHRELNPTAFRVFGPKLVAMREQFGDRALESRFLTEETGSQPLPSHIPIHLPDSLREEALELRNRLLAWRFSARHSVGPNPERLVKGISPRLNQTGLALLSLVDDAGLRERIAAKLAGEEARGLEERASSAEAVVLAELVAAFSAGAQSVGLSELAATLSTSATDRFATPVSPKWMGWFVRDRLRLQTRKSSGLYVIPQTERLRIDELAHKWGVAA